MTGGDGGDGVGGIAVVVDEDRAMVVGRTENNDGVMEINRDTSL